MLTTISRQLHSRCCRIHNIKTQTYLKNCRMISSGKDDLEHANPKPTQTPSKLKRYLLGKYTIYLDKFQESLANELPKTTRMIRIFSRGLKTYIIDVKDLTKVVMKLSLPMYNLETMTWKEINTYYFIPWQMVKVLPVLVLSAIPFGQYVVFPIALCFPKTLLSYHFWDWNQKIDFGIDDLKKRLFNARPVFRAIQDRVQDIKDEKEMKNCLKLFHAIGSGLYLSDSEIYSLSGLFQDHPFSLDYIYASHVKALMRLHGLSTFIPRRRLRLRNHALRLNTLDNAVVREGLESFSIDELKYMLIFRGLNPRELSNDEIIKYIKNWLCISKSLIITKDYSLLLHLPILMAYNNPRNLSLIYQ